MLFDEENGIDESSVLSASVVYENGTRLDAKGKLPRDGVQFVIVFYLLGGQPRVAVYSSVNEYRVPWHDGVFLGKWISDEKWKRLSNKIHADAQRELRELRV